MKYAALSLGLLCLALVAVCTFAFVATGLPHFVILGASNAVLAAVNLRTARYWMAQ